MSGLMKTWALGCFLLSLGAAAPAWAIPITLSFTADGFGSGPEASISGSFDYNASSVTSNTITSLNSVNLTIDGHTYTVGDLGTAVRTIGGTLNGVNTIATGTNDFILGFDAGNDVGLDFLYSTPGGDIYATYSFSHFSITADTPAVPEPGSWLVFLTGIAGIGFLVAHRRRLN